MVSANLLSMREEALNSNQGHRDGKDIKGHLSEGQIQVAEFLHDRLVNGQVKDTQKDILATTQWCCSP